MATNQDNILRARDKVLFGRRVAIDEVEMA
jgi:hypothetical protein